MASFSKELGQDEAKRTRCVSSGNRHSSQLRSLFGPHSPGCLSPAYRDKEEEGLEGGKKADFVLLGEKLVSNNLCF